MKEDAKEYLRLVCEAIKSHGMRVFVRKDCTYGYFSDGKGVGYFQLEYSGYAGFSISTVNAKGSSCSGYSVAREIGIADLTEGMLKEAFLPYPSWVCGLDMVRVKKYKDLDDFLRNYENKDNLIEV